MVTFDELMNGSEITDEQIRQDSSVNYPPAKAGGLQTSTNKT